MLGLITDRAQANVDRCNTLASKGWHNMTAAEQAEWTGNILTPELAGYTGAVNLLPNKDTDTVKFKNRIMTVSANSFFVIGPAADYENKTLTLSVAEAWEGSPQMGLCWRNSAGGSMDAIGALGSVGAVTLETGANEGNYDSLVMFFLTDGIYVDVMLQFGDVAHPYVPYTEALATSARKGAYNYADWNRVERAVAEISDELELGLVTKTDWTEWNFPKQADVDRYLSNVKAIREKVGSLATTPTLPNSLGKLSYTKANDIEKVISDASDILEVVYRSGDIFCNEV